jgi:hypothetical protein
MASPKTPEPKTAEPPDALLDEALDEGLEESFPASDPPSAARRENREDKETPP